MNRGTQLALLASRDVGELKAGLQLVVFLTTTAIALVKEILATYENGKAAVMSGQAAKGLPLKCKVYEKILAVLQEIAETKAPQAVTVLTQLQQMSLQGTITSIIGLNRFPPDDKPWILVIQLANSPEGRQARDLWNDQHLQALYVEVNGVWPSVSIKSEQWKPSRLFAEVSRDIGRSAPGSKRSPPVKRRSASPQAAPAASRQKRR